MKKVLIATTALVATASVAAADVTFSGYGRFGVLYYEDNEDNSDAAIAAADAALAAAQATFDGAPTAANLEALADAAEAADDARDRAVQDFAITSRLRIQIDGTAESDNGLAFGARVRIQQNNRDVGAHGANEGPTSGPAGTGINGARFFVRSGGLTVQVGNISGALESMPGQYPIDLGLTGLGYDYTAYNFRGDAYSSGANGSAGSDGIEVLYSMGDFSAHLSASDTNNRIAGYVAYTFGDWTAALGLQDSDSDADTEWTASISGDIGPANVTFSYADNGTGGDHYVLAGRFDVGASTNVEAYYAYAEDTFSDDDSYGVDFNHNLGGGTSLRGGIAKRGNGRTMADLGFRFNF